MTDDPNWRPPLNYQPSQPSRGPDRLLPLARAGLLLGIVNCVWAVVGFGFQRLAPSPDARAIVFLLLCGVIPSAVVGVVLAFTSTRNDQRWTIFITNAVALSFVTFLLFRRV